VLDNIIFIINDIANQNNEILKAHIAYNGEKNVKNSNIIEM